MMTDESYAARLQALATLAAAAPPAPSSFWPQGDPCPDPVFEGPDGSLYSNVRAAERAWGEDGFTVKNQGELDAWERKRDMDRIVQWRTQYAVAMLEALSRVV